MIRYIKKYGLKNYIIHLRDSFLMSWLGNFCWYLFRKTPSHPSRIRYALDIENWKNAFEFANWQKR